MKKIHNFLIDKKYNIECFYDELIYVQSDFINFRISKENNKYIVDYALLSYFDRWANSGYEKTFETENEVINFMSNETELLVDALSELTYSIFGTACDSDDDKKAYIINKCIDFLMELNKESTQNN